MADGKECTCAAHSESECGCDADWTTQEVYDLRAENDRLKTAIRRLANEDATLSLLCKMDGSQVVTVQMDAGEWIPVSERLPEEYELVMVGWAGRRDIGKGYLLNGKWHDPLVCTPDVNQPSHWMPLPEPPSE